MALVLRKAIKPLSFSLTRTLNSGSLSAGVVRRTALNAGSRRSYPGFLGRRIKSKSLHTCRRIRKDSRFNHTLTNKLEKLSVSDVRTLCAAKCEPCKPFQSYLPPPGCAPPQCAQFITGYYYYPYGYWYCGPYNACAPCTCPLCKTAPCPPCSGPPCACACPTPCPPCPCTPCPVPCKPCCTSCCPPRCLCTACAALATKKDDKVKSSFEKLFPFPPSASGNVLPSEMLSERVNCNHCNDCNCGLCMEMRNRPMPKLTPRKVLPTKRERDRPRFDSTEEFCLKKAKKFDKPYPDVNIEPLCLDYQKEADAKRIEKPKED